MAKKMVNLVSNFVLFVVVGVCLVAGFTLGQNNASLYASASASDGVIYEGNRNGNNVALMINVYWGTEYLDSMLDALDAAGAKTTFFVGGLWVAEHPDELSNLVSRGHEIANHGYYHKDHAKLDLARNREEIEITHNLVKDTCGAVMNLFAPPSGSYNRTTVAAAQALGYKTIMWSRDTVDWRDKDQNIIYSRAVKGIKGGDLILMHPTSETAKALPRILQTIGEKGLVANTVSKTLE